MDDKEFVRLAIEQSRLSVNEGRFPAGCVVVFGGEVIASEMSDSFPGYQHAECRAVDSAFQRIGRLTGAVLYASMEPCLMCLTRAYWSGIRRIVYAIGKSNLNKRYYEGAHNNSEIAGELNESVECVQISDLENEALAIVLDWEKINS